MNNSDTPLNGSTVLITGVSGFIGRHLAKACLLKNARVFGISRSETKSLSTEVEFILGDITEREKVNNVIRKIKPSYIFHLAANKVRNVEPDDFRESYNENLIGTLNVVEACLSLPVNTRLLTIGTCEEYGDKAPFIEDMRETPLSAYSCSKAAVTHLLQTIYRTHGVQSIILRPTLAYGPGQGNEMFIPAIINSLLRNEKFPMSGGEQTRDFVYIDDLIDAILKTMVIKNPGSQIINVSSCEPIKIIDLANMISTIIGNNSSELLEIGELEYRTGETMNYWAENKKIKKLLNWKPRTSLESGLRKTINYYNEAIKNMKCC